MSNYLHYGESYDPNNKEWALRKDLFNIHEGMEDLNTRLEEECASHSNLEGMLWNVASRGNRKYWESERLSRISWYKDAISLENKILSVLAVIQEEYVVKNRLSKPTWVFARKCKDRIYALRMKENRITYTQWAMLTNYCNRLLSVSKRHSYNDDEDLALYVENLYSRQCKDDFFLNEEDKDLAHNEWVKEQAAKPKLQETYTLPSAPQWSDVHTLVEMEAETQYQLATITGYKTW